MEETGGGRLLSGGGAVRNLGEFLRPPETGVMDEPAKAVLARELAYHEKLYSGFAQAHFARPAVRALREHMVRRILQATGAGPRSRVLSLGCGIGDTELLQGAHGGTGEVRLGKAG